MLNTKIIRALFLVLLVPVFRFAEAAVEIAHWVAPSGARVFFVETHVLPILDVQIDFAAGSALDPLGKAGLAAMTMGLIDHGVEGMDETAIASRLTDLGALLGGGVDRDRASIALRTLSDEDKRVPALEIMEAVVSAPLFPEEVLAREKARTVSHLKEGLTRPGVLASRAFWSAAYPSHPYGRLTSPESLEALQRSDLQAFYSDFYSAARASLTIVGDLTRPQAEELARKLTARLPEGRAPERIDRPELPQGGERRVAHPATQAHIFIGLPAIARGDPDYFPLLVGNHALGGGGFVSRLMREVREKRGFAYSVYSAFSPMAQLGPFQIGLQTKKQQVDEALKLTREVLARFLAEGPDKAELETAKQNLVGSFPLRLDSNRKILENVAVVGFFDYPLDYLDRYAENVEKVTAAEVRDAFARRVKLDALVTVVVAGD
ncbi:MAG: insulinase family protein [Candidatus Accumulibacter sp.]|jgi:zinc protease|nr:insulinase family protein [Accumulibacter sp.]